MLENVNFSLREKLTKKLEIYIRKFILLIPIRKKNPDYLVWIFNILNKTHNYLRQDLKKGISEYIKRTIIRAIQQNTIKNKVIVEKPHNKEDK